jgi:hypothetical protein
MSRGDEGDQDGTMSATLHQDCHTVAPYFYAVLHLFSLLWISPCPDRTTVILPLASAAPRSWFRLTFFGPCSWGW